MIYSQRRILWFPAQMCIRDSLKSIDLENYVTMILAMQDGILALRVLDETIDEEEKYTKIQYQMWKEISTAKMQNYEDGGVTSAVS